MFFDNIELPTDGAFSSGEDLLPIPANTGLRAFIEEANWDEYQGLRLIKLKWRVQGGEYDNRVVYQKLHVNDASKAGRAKSMLAAIDQNSGGKLMAAGVEPTDEALMLALTNKAMGIKVDVWEIEGKTGNWVKAVAPLKAGSTPAPAVPRAAPAAPRPAPAPAPAPSDDFSDDIPF